MLPRLFLILIIFIAGCSINNNYSLKLENDIVGKSDENYTHGTIIKHNIKYEEASILSKRIAENLPAFRLYDSDPEELTTIETELGQEIHTPSDIEKYELIEDDNPYAGYLYGKISRINSNEFKRLETGISIGIVGRHSFSEDVQKFVHNNLGLGPPPNGWDNQLSDELALNGNYTRTVLTKIYDNLDTITISSLRLGNIHTDLTHEKNIRFGYNLPNLISITNLFSCYLFGNAGINLVGRNIFYDGNTFKKSHSVDTIPLVGFIGSGVSAGYNNYNLKFQTQITSKQFEEQSKSYHIFGGLTFGVDW